MRQKLLAVVFFVTALGLILPITSAQAQATRTWVSGVGDDANPCSRTAPCKTFAGAISKTAAGGEINCIDPGGFGGVTITKSITIDCASTEAGVLVAGSNGITVNAGVNDIVHLRGLDIIGTVSVPALNGIRFVAGAALHVEKCTIREFLAGSPNGFGILFQPSGTSELYVADSYFTNNGSGSTGGAIMVQPTGTGKASATINLVRANNNINGFSIDATAGTGNSSVTVRDSESNGATLTGFSVLTTAVTGFAGMSLDRASSNLNGTGLKADGSKSSIIITASSIIANTGTGLATANGGQILTFQNNNVFGNNPDGSTTSPLSPK